MKAAKLTSKFQTTVPLEIRKHLKLGQGDFVTFEIEDGRVILKKATRADLEYLRSLESTLSEWNSKYDDEAFEDL